jgi:hypothetical protein
MLPLLLHHRLLHLHLLLQLPACHAWHPAAPLLLLLLHQGLLLLLHCPSAALQRGQRPQLLCPWACPCRVQSSSQLLLPSCPALPLLPQLLLLLLPHGPAAACQRTESAARQQLLAR